MAPHGIPDDVQDPPLAPGEDMIGVGIRMGVRIRVGPAGRLPDRCRYGLLRPTSWLPLGPFADERRRRPWLLAAGLFSWRSLARQVSGIRTGALDVRRCVLDDVQ